MLRVLYVDENTENTDGKAGLVHIVSAEHGRRAGEQGRDKESRKNAEHEREDDAKDAEAADLERASGGIVEQKVADKGRERGGEHGQMQVVPDRDLFDVAIDEHADKGGPHIDEVQAVEAMRDDQQIGRKGGAVGVGAADCDD